MCVCVCVCVCACVVCVWLRMYELCAEMHNDPNTHTHKHTQICMPSLPRPLPSSLLRSLHVSHLHGCKQDIAGVWAHMPWRRGMLRDLQQRTLSASYPQSFMCIRECAGMMHPHLTAGNRGPSQASLNTITNLFLRVRTRARAHARKDT